MIQLYLMGVIYTILGVVHFTHTGFYRPLMPRFLPAHDLLIYLSGVAEIVLGIGILFPQTRSVAVWGLIAMLIVFLIVRTNRSSRDTVVLNTRRSSKTIEKSYSSWS